MLYIGLTQLYIGQLLYIGLTLSTPIQEGRALVRVRAATTNRPRLLRRQPRTVNPGGVPRP